MRDEFADVDCDAPMTPEDALRGMRVCAGSHDTERAHTIADEILVNVLRQMGMDELCDEYERVGKWYA